MLKVIIKNKWKTYWSLLNFNWKWNINIDLIYEYITYLKECIELMNNKKITNEEFNKMYCISLI